MKLDLLQGTLDLLILRTLQTGAETRLGDLGTYTADFARCVACEPGWLYPALHRLEHQGWIAAEWGISELGRARNLQANAAGRKQLGVETESWARLTAAIGAC